MCERPVTSSISSPTQVAEEVSNYEQSRHDCQGRLGLFFYPCHTPLPKYRRKGRAGIHQAVNFLPFIDLPDHYT